MYIVWKLRLMCLSVGKANLALALDIGNTCMARNYFVMKR